MITTKDVIWCIDRSNRYLELFNKTEPSVEKDHYRKSFLHSQEVIDVACRKLYGDEFIDNLNKTIH